MASSPRMPLKVGLVGFGYAGQTFHAPLLQATPGLTLCAVASRQGEAVRQALGQDVQVVADSASLLADPALDLIVIASPNDSHFPLAQAALQAGKAVVVDKPLALDRTEAAALVALARSTGRLLSVFHNRRWDGDFLTVARCLRSGALGRLTQARLCFDRYRPVVRTRWRESAVPGAGLWSDLGPHLIDQALQLFGPPQNLRAELNVQRSGAVVDDQFTAQLCYPQGLRVTLQASQLAALPGPRFELHGEQGSLRSWGLDAQEDDLKAGQRPDPAMPEAWGRHHGQTELMLADEAGQPRRLDLPLQAGRYTAYYAQLRDALCGLADNPVRPEEALDVMRWLDLGRLSASTGRTLGLADLDAAGPD